MGNAGILAVERREEGGITCKGINVKLHYYSVPCDVFRSLPALVPLQDCSFFCTQLSSSALLGLPYISSPGEGKENDTPCLENPMGRGLVGCSPWGRKELGTTERLTNAFYVSLL